MAKNKYAAECAVGDVISCSSAKSGSSQNGKAWMLIPVKAEEGYNKLALWVRNPEDCVNARYVKIKKIESVSVTSRKSQDGSKYYTDMSVSARVEPLSGMVDEEFKDISDDPLADLFK